MSVFDGQGIFVWKVKSCTNRQPANSPAAYAHILDVIQRGGFAYAAVKVADGIVRFNQRPVGDRYVDDILPGLFASFHGAGLPLIGWHYLYGANPIGEAETAAARIKQFGLQGYILDPESEYCLANDGTATRFMRRLRELVDVPLALCSYRYPSLHRELPWMEFLNGMDANHGDVHMPQVYWEADASAQGPTKQLAQSWAELKKLKELPVVPVGPAYGRAFEAYYWASTPEQMINFNQAAHDLRCPGISWWAWDEMAEKDGAGPADVAGPRGWWRATTDISKTWTPVIVAPEPVLTDMQRIERLESAARAHGWEL